MDGKIVARFYETGETVDAGNAYKMVIQGSGEIIIYSGDFDEYWVWQKDRDEETGLNYIEIPEGVTTMGDYVFALCSNITVTLPKSLTSIGSNIFKYASPVQVNYRGTEAEYNAISGISNAKINCTVVYDYVD